MATKKKPMPQLIEMALIDPPVERIRMEIDDDYISELALSITEIGLLQPILIRPVQSRYEVVAGECRYIAYQKLQLGQIAAIVRVMTDKEVDIARATENLRRCDLSPLEESATYQNLMDRHGMSIEQVAEKVGLKPGTVKRKLDLMKMNPMLQALVHTRRISVSVAEELWPISNDTDLEYYLSFAVDNGATKEVARQWVKEWRDGQRRLETPGVEGRASESPQSPRPVYLPCDLCQQAVELGKDIFMRVCPACKKRVSEVKL